MSKFAFFYTFEIWKHQLPQMIQVVLGGSELISQQKVNYSALRSSWSDRIMRRPYLTICYDIL